MNHIVMVSVIGALQRTIELDSAIEQFARVHNHQYYNRKRGNCYPGKVKPSSRLQTELKSRDFL